MENIKALVKFFIKFLESLIVGSFVAIFFYFVITVALLSLKIIKTSSLLFVFIIPFLIICVLIYSWWRAHQSFFAKSSKEKQSAGLMVAYVSALVLSIGGLVLIIAFLSSLFMTRGMGMVSWHKPKMGFFQPNGYSGPAIPKTARNIHIEQRGWLDGFLFLRFEDQVNHLEEFARLARAPLTKGIYLPGKDTMFESLILSSTYEAKFAPFADVKLIKQGRSFLDKRENRCLVIDDDTQTLYYFIW